MYHMLAREGGLGGVAFRRGFNRLPAHPALSPFPEAF